MTVIDTQLSILEKVLAPMRKEALKELSIHDARGWNEKGITHEQLEEMLFQFAVDNLDELSTLSDDMLRIGGALIVLHIFYQDVLNDSWDVSALSL